MVRPRIDFRFQVDRVANPGCGRFECGQLVAFAESVLTDFRNWPITSFRCPAAIRSLEEDEDEEEEDRAEEPIVREPDED